MPRVLRSVFVPLLVALAVPAGASVRDYDIAYVRQARFGDSINTTWPEVFHPAQLDPGADLMLLHPDGTEELLVAGGNGGSGSTTRTSPTCGRRRSTASATTCRMRAPTSTGSTWRPDRCND
jgi:hypothetical protein